MEGAALRHGWFVIPDVQTGDRTVEQQTKALAPAIAECAGKSILDIGCAEGLVGREFVRAGARCCLGIDTVQDHIHVAMSQCEGLPMSFHLASIAQFENEPIPNPFGVEQYDIVLALGVAHKLEHPRVAIEVAARYCKDLMLLRRGLRQVDGVVSSKHFNNKADTHAILRDNGFEMEKLVKGPAPFFEAVEYWRRQK